MREETGWWGEGGGRERLRNKTVVESGEEEDDDGERWGAERKRTHGERWERTRESGGERESERMCLHHPVGPSERRVILENGNFL
jgi:hypothetical protein